MVTAPSTVAVDSAAGFPIGRLRHADPSELRQRAQELQNQRARDPDAVATELEFTAEEGKVVADLLGGTQIIESLQRLQQQVEGLAIDWLPVPATSRFVGRTIADGETLDDILPDAFATVREAARRQIGQFHADVDVGVVGDAGDVARTCGGLGTLANQRTQCRRNTRIQFAIVAGTWAAGGISQAALVEHVAVGLGTRRRRCCNPAAAPTADFTRLKERNSSAINIVSAALD